MVGFYLPKLIGLCGRKGSGKDTAAKALAEQYGYKIVKFAAPLKAMVNALLDSQGVSLQLRERMIEGDLKEVPTGYLGGRSPRYAMQTLGTEWGRDLIDKNFWTQAFVNQINFNENTRYVCTDMRFANESSIVKELGGLRVRISRVTQHNQFSAHPSEAEIDNLVVDKELTNDSTIEAIQNKLLEYAAFEKMHARKINLEEPQTIYVSIN